MSPRTYEEEPSVADYRRSVSGYDSGSDRGSDSDREISLSTPTILGLFVALAIVCACFFGLGYALGHRTPSDEPAVYAGTTAVGTGASKPAAGSTAQQSIDNTAALATDTSASAVQNASQTATVPLTSASTPNPPAATPPAPAAQAAAAAPSSAAPAGVFVVQVAAVSSQDVADILISSLQKKGYAVAVHPSPQDKLLHVQIGPFADRATADTMRQRVLADGFNAIVK